MNMTVFALKRLLLLFMNHHYSRVPGCRRNLSVYCKRIAAAACISSSAAQTILTYLFIESAYICQDLLKEPRRAAARGASDMAQREGRAQGL